MRRMKIFQLGGFFRGVSVGCGSGIKEMMLVRAGIVERFELFEISEHRVNLGIETAEKRGISDRIEFHLAHAFE